MPAYKPPNRRKFIQQSALVSLGFMALSRCTSDTNEKKAAIDLSLQKDAKNYLELPA